MIACPARSESSWFIPADLVVAFACFVATLLTWAAWMRWGVDLDVDYPAGRVVGLALTLALIGLPLAWLNWAGSVIVAMPPALAVSAFYDWQAQDESGLFVVGVLLVLIGSLAVTALITPFVAAAGRRQRR
ncbi:hypothetical protein [Kineosporia babensis]|uniref:Uncharacterized protein n=1 Tax=Kineosporia babensis TaxID=499548 RepID=A0A9X1NBD2_9ACTN|nr:hypothetical protein [Kineosporia babensis]MCD5312107.1 hypothetical protein [Kineosporia babensis]